MISENKKTILIDLLKASEDEFSDFMHIIEEDTNIPNDSFYYLDNQSQRLFRLFRLMYDELYYT